MRSTGCINSKSQRPVGALAFVKWKSLGNRSEQNSLQEADLARLRQLGNLATGHRLVLFVGA